MYLVLFAQPLTGPWLWPGLNQSMAELAEGWAWPGRASPQESAVRQGPPPEVLLWFFLASLL